jgi:hypothetical protein
LGIKRLWGSFLDHGLSNDHLVGILLLQIWVALHLCQAFFGTALGLPSLHLFLSSKNGATLITAYAATHHDLTHTASHGILHTFFLAGLLLKLDKLLGIIIAIVGGYDNTAGPNSASPGSSSSLDELESEEQLKKGLLRVVLILRLRRVVVRLAPMLDEMEALLCVDFTDLATDVHFS